MERSKAHTISGGGISANVQWWCAMNRAGQQAGTDDTLIFYILTLIPPPQMLVEGMGMGNNFPVNEAGLSG